AEVVAATIGTVVSAEAIARAEGVAKKKLDAKQLLPPLVDNEVNRAWGAFMATLVQLATGVDEARAGECARALWRGPTRGRGRARCGGSIGGSICGGRWRTGWSTGWRRCVRAACRWRWCRIRKASCKRSLTNWGSVECSIW